MQLRHNRMVSTDVKAKELVKPEHFKLIIRVHQNMAKADMYGTMILYLQ